MTLSPRVRCALHAIAIDEKRGPFGPTLWVSDVGPADGQAVEQVWFPVVHSNVGGSYDYKGLSDLALNCMFQRVSEHTLLEFDGDYISRDIEGDALATLYESRTPLYTVSRVMPFCRVIGGADHWVSGLTRKFRMNKPRDGQAFINEMLHRSALDRLGQNAKFQEGDRKSTRRYEPRNLIETTQRLPVVEYDGSISPTAEL